MSHHDSISQTPKSSPQFLLGAGVAFLLLLALASALLVDRSSSPTETEDMERAEVRAKNLAELSSADTALLTSYGWTDQARGIVHIPITNAMQLVLPSLNARAAIYKQP